MLWFIGKKDRNWYWLFKADTSLLHLIFTVFPLLCYISLPPLYFGSWPCSFVSSDSFSVLAVCWSVILDVYLIICQFPKRTAHYYHYSPHCYLGLIWFLWVLNLSFLSFWSRSVAPISSSDVSLPTSSLDLPDVADLFAPPADNASRKRESNGSALHDSRNKFPRMQSQSQGIGSAAGNALIPPQLRGRLVSFFFLSISLWRLVKVRTAYYMYSLVYPPQLTSQMLTVNYNMRHVGAFPGVFAKMFTLYISHPWVMSTFLLLLHRSNVVTEDMSKLFVAKRKE